MVIHLNKQDSNPNYIRKFPNEKFFYSEKRRFRMTYLPAFPVTMNPIITFNFIPQSEWNS